MHQEYNSLGLIAPKKPDVVYCHTVDEALKIMSADRTSYFQILIDESDTLTQGNFLNFLKLMNVVKRRNKPPSVILFSACTLFYNENEKEFMKDVMQFNTFSYAG